MEFRCCQKPDTQRKFWCLFQLSGILDKPLCSIKDTNAPKSVVVAVAWLQKEYKSPADKRLLRLIVLVSFGHSDTGQKTWGTRCLGKIRSKKLPFIRYLASYLHPLVQTQPGSSLWALITHVHDLGHWVGNRPIPEWQGDAALGVWVKFSGPGCGAAGDDQLWWKCERAYAYMKAHHKRTSEAGAGSWHPAGRAHKPDFVLPVSTRYI